MPQSPVTSRALYRLTTLRDNELGREAVPILDPLAFRDPPTAAWGGTLDAIGAAIRGGTERILREGCDRLTQLTPFSSDERSLVTVAARLALVENVLQKHLTT